MNIDLQLLDRRQPFALYIHLPFCHYRCHYCDFYASAGVASSLRRAVIDRMYKEVETQLHFLEMTSLDSVYFGGGTPSMIDRDQLKTLIDLVQRYQPQQVTIEVNPEDVDVALLETIGVKRWKNIRMSMGLQTFHQPSLDAVGRKVNIPQMDEALRLLEPYKMILNLDVIAGLPLHTRQLVESDMQKIVDYAPSHISLYALAMEEGTILTYKEHPDLPSEDERAILWQASQSMLLAHGYQQYEISNYALDKESYSRQNMHYWQLKPYLGIGPGAVGTIVLMDGSALRITGRRELKMWQDTRNEELWLYERIDRSTFLFEHYMMGLRTTLGVNKQILLERFGQEGLEPWSQLSRSQWAGYLVENSDYLTLTEQGRLFLDSILLELL